MPPQPPELAISDSVAMLDRFESLVQFWFDLDPGEALTGDDDFPRCCPASRYLDESPAEFRRFWQITQSHPDAGLSGNGDEILCDRKTDASWCDDGYVHLTHDTICSSVVGVRLVDGAWKVTRLSSGGLEDSPLSVGNYLISFGLMQLAQEPGKFNGTWGEADNISRISAYLQADSNRVWEANLWGNPLDVYFHQRGVLWYILGSEICVTARNRVTFQWFDKNWWREDPTELTRLDEKAEIGAASAVIHSAHED